MKHLLLLLVISLSPISSFAQRGSEGVGGGDVCENRIKDIKNDIASWIQKGGHKDLKFSEFQTPELYKRAMLMQLEAAKIQCVSAGDREFPVNVQNVPKICKFAFSSAGSFVTCDRKAFLQLDESAQYRLIHHEYAGLAQMEMPNGADSTYNLSNQISAYLETRQIKFLAVKKPDPTYELDMTCTAQTTKAGTLVAKKDFKVISTNSYADKNALYNNEVNRAEVGPYMIAFEVNPFRTISSGLYREGENFTKRLFQPNRTKEHVDAHLMPALTHGATFQRSYRRADETFSVACGNAKSNHPKPSVAVPIRAECRLEVHVDGAYNYPKDRMIVEANSQGRLAVAGFYLDVKTSGESLSVRLTDVKTGQSADYFSSCLPSGGEEEYSFWNSEKVYRMEAFCKAL